MEKIIANVDDITFDIEIQLENQTGALPLPFPKMNKGDAPICKFFMLPSGCRNNELCPFRHIRQDRTVVCKHWLKGLCKKGDECEFLHSYDLQKMPECFFFSKYKVCHNKDCKFLHVNPEDKMQNCSWYKRGFCRNGPYCKRRHVRIALCENYVAGFCPLGPNCKDSHPKYDLPVISDGQNPKKPETSILTCTFCGNNGHIASHCFKMKMSANSGTLPQGAPSQNTKFKSLDEVTCFKCSEKGHYANKCTKSRLDLLGKQKVLK